MWELERPRPPKRLHVSGGDIRLDVNRGVEFGVSSVGVSSSLNDLSAFTWANMRFYANTDNSGVGEDSPFITNVATTTTTGASMVISDTGNVGIATMSPGRKLTVNGRIEADGGFLFKPRFRVPLTI